MNIYKSFDHKTWRRKPAGMDMERNYVTVILCIPRGMMPRQPIFVVAAGRRRLVAQPGGLTPGLALHLVEIYYAKCCANNQRYSAESGLA